MKDELELWATEFLSDFPRVEERLEAAMRADGIALARRLTKRTMDLSYSKATEFSQKIPLYTLLAAKVALLVYWPDEAAFNRYEKAIRYYRSFKNTRELAEEYEAFREAHASDERSD